MYRSRPKENLDKDTLKFLSSMGYDQQILYYDLLGSQAHVIMLREMGHLTNDELKKILEALEEVKKNPSKLDLTGDFEDIHESVEAFVVKNAGMESGGKMHTARSRNDQVVLDIRMKLRDDINNICAAIIELIDSLLAKAEENKKAPMLMYTHLQQAQIGTFSHYLLSYADSLFRDMERLYVTYGRINQSPLGAGAIGGSSLSTDRKKTAVSLGFDSLVKNSIDATSSRDAFLEYAAAVSILMMTLGRMAEDFIIWSTSEFGYIELADKYSSTSSAMPQKKNADPLELMRAKSAVVLGNLVAMLGIVKALPSGYSRDLQDLKPPLFDASSTALETLKIMDGIVKSIHVHREKMLEAAKDSYAVSIDIAEQLVIKYKMPFRKAHMVVGSLVEKAAGKKNLPLAKLDVADVSSVLKSLKADLVAEDVMQIIKEMTPEKSLELRASSGSPNLKEQEEMIAHSLRRLAGYKEGVQKRKGFVAGAINNLSESVEKYLHG